jgi:hypothetical protein
MGEEADQLCGNGFPFGERLCISAQILEYSRLSQYFLWNARIGKMQTAELISRMSTYYAPLLDSFGPNLIVSPFHAASLPSQLTFLISLLSMADWRVGLYSQQCIDDVAGLHRIL